MKRLTILLAGVSLFASDARAGSVSNVPGTLDTTLVDPAPLLYPHFICASGCGGGSINGAVSQSGVWNVGVSNFPTLQAVTGTVYVPGVATATNQPALDPDGGSLGHVTNFPLVQAVSGAVSVGNFPTNQSVSGSVAVSNLPPIQPVSGSVSVGNFPATQAISGTVSIGTSVGFGGVGNPSSYVESIQGVAGGAPLNVSKSDGSDVTLGSKGDAASATGSASVVAILKQIHLDGIGPLPPGSNVVGSVSLAPSGNAVQPQGFAPFVALTLTNNCYNYSSPATLFSLAGYSPQANLWILIYNQSSTPADGSATSPTYFYGPLSSSGAWSLAFPTPPFLGTAMTLCYSTTGPAMKTSTSGITVGGAFEGVHN